MGLLYMCVGGGVRGCCTVCGVCAWSTVMHNRYKNILVCACAYVYNSNYVKFQ